MNLLWRKARGDARAHGRRLTLIGLVLFISAAAATAMWSARQVLVREIAASFSQAQVVMCTPGKMLCRAHSSGVGKYMLMRDPHAVKVANASPLPR